jgi:GMP synthase (glutamine-hydrolysing)
MSRASAELLCIVHQEAYHLGRLLPVLRRRRFLIRQVLAPFADFKRLQTRGFDGVVVLGGDMGAHDSDNYPFLQDEIEFLGATHNAQVPILGICLGGQLVTRALGGVVRPGAGREVGWHTVRVLEGGSLLGRAGMYRKFLWHRDAFELPSGAKPLAFTRTCLQAYRLGHAYALQFHPEIMRHQVSALMKGHSANLLRVNEAEAEEILKTTVREDGAYGRAASHLADAFCDEVASCAALRTRRESGSGFFTAVEHTWT